MTVLNYEPATQNGSGLARVLRILGWAIFLGMSWTWCIGMFLPVLLVRDYGIWGWIVFAIPNVIGAVAVGFINRTAEQSRETVIAHRPMMLVFSAVTATFQIFFAWWMFDQISSVPRLYLIVMFAFALIAVALPLSRSPSIGTVVATLVFLVSIICIIAYGRNDIVIRPIMVLADLRHGLGFPILPLAASTCFGFLLCPHLDISFHRTRQQLSTDDAHAAFGFGLGIVFFAMIFFSLLYSEHLAYVLEHYDWVISSLSVYFLVQLAFTTGVHWQAHALFPAKGSLLLFVAMILGTSLLGSACYFIVLPRLYPELIYRLFLSFYGLLFPAYVYLCMIPGRGRVAPSRKQWIALTISVLLAAPFFWLAFIDRKMFYVLPGLGIVLFARLLIPRPKSGSETVVC
jgi:hypothetical protein